MFKQLAVSLYLVISVMTIALVWAALAQIEEVTRVQGILVSEGGEYPVPLVENSLLTTLNIRAGEKVTQHQMLGDVVSLRDITRCRALLLKEELGCQQQAKTTLHSPVKGIVKEIRYLKSGEIIPAGTTWMTIIPDDAPLLVEARIKPADIAFLHPGMPATLKFSAYDYGIYGGLSATVDYVSTGAFVDDSPSDGGYYRMTLRPDSQVLSSGNKHYPLLPGMVVTADIKTGQRTLLHYLLKPILKARDAFHER